MSKRNKNKKRHTTINEHRRDGSKLISPMGNLSMEPFDWLRDLLPEYLWLASLAELFTIEDVHKPFFAFMDALDQYLDKDMQVIGHLSDFNLLNEEQKNKFWNENETIIIDLFYKPIGRILSFYPENPASWLIRKEIINKDKSLDPDYELGSLRRLLKKLFPGKDAYTGHLRSLPLARLMKHGKIYFKEGMDVIELLPKYPAGCNEEEKSHVQSFARSTTNIFIQTNDIYKDHIWSKYFWRHNYDLAVCKPYYFSTKQSIPVNESQQDKIAEVLSQNVKVLSAYLNELINKVKIDLYDPLREEILFGLFSRLIRLYCIIASDFNLWAKDTSGIILRSLTDVAITFSYLSKCGTENDFSNFKKYGEGQEKLLMLHLQDNYPDSKTIEGLGANELSDELGRFEVELLDIELKSWTKKDTRKLATEAGMEKYYRLVYSPTSADLHGTWQSLKDTSLCRCGEILHRFHRLPYFYEPPVYLNTFFIAQDIVLFCINVAYISLKYPKLKEELLYIKA